MLSIEEEEENSRNNFSDVAVEEEEAKNEDNNDYEEQFENEKEEEEEVCCSDEEIQQRRECVKKNYDGIVIDENTTSSMTVLRMQKTKKCKSAMKRKRAYVEELHPSIFKQTNKRKNSRKTVNEISWNHVDIVALHEAKMKEFEEKRETQLARLQKQLEKNSSNIEKAAKIRSEITTVESREDELEYLMKVSPIINEYLALAAVIPTSLPTSSDYNNENIDKNSNIERKHALISEYFSLTQNLPVVNVKANDATTCTICGGSTLVCEGFVTCTVCGAALERSMKFEPGYRDMNSVSIKHQFSYKRLNRFNEILSTVQGKENSDVPLAIIEAIKKEIQKNRSLSISSLTVPQIRTYLKRIGQNHYYEHSTRILSHLNGNQPERLTSNVEERLRQMFRDIQAPFEKARERVCPNRSSFLNYNYVLYKFCEKLGMYSFAKRFTLLKSVEKLRLQDMIWKDICEQLEWDFIPTC